LQIFFADSKSRAQELSNGVSFFIFGHQTWDLEGERGQIDPPSISWFSSTLAEIGLKRFKNFLAIFSMIANTPAPHLPFSLLCSNLLISKL